MTALALLRSSTSHQELDLPEVADPADCNASSQFHVPTLRAYMSCRACQALLKGRTISPRHQEGSVKSMSEHASTKETQYSLLFDVKEKHGIARFGLMANESWKQDPKRTLFTLARYKFVARMLNGRKRVLEVGCADAFGTRIVQQAVGKVTAVDRSYFHCRCK
jgi:hypothetical protein